jgi:hypothetical protein
MPAVASEFADGGVAAAIELAEGGAAVAGAAAVAVCGTDCVEGRAGAACATSDAFSGDASCFQKAQRGPDWQPVIATIARTTNRARFAREIMDWLPSRLTGVSTENDRRGNARTNCGSPGANSCRSVEKLVVSKSSAKPPGAVHRFDYGMPAARRPTENHPSLAARSRTDARRDYSGGGGLVNGSPRLGALDAIVAGSAGVRSPLAASSSPAGSARCQKAGTDERVGSQRWVREERAESYVPANCGSDEILRKMFGDSIHPGKIEL